MPTPDQLALALLLAGVPLAAAGLVLHLARPLGAAERGVVAGAVLLFVLSALLAPQLHLHDQWTHFSHVREALRNPLRLLDPWDRPGFTLLYAGPAALGLTAARLTSAIPAALALVATARAARSLGAARPWVPVLLLAAQYDFFGQASSTMTELPFAAAFAVAVLGWAEERPWLAASGLGWMALSRPEGPLFALLGAAGLLLRPEAAPADAPADAPRRGLAERLGPALLALLPFAAYLAIGAIAWRDPLWLVHGNPYRRLVALRLDPAQLADSFFFEALRRGQPPVLIALEAAGAALALAGPARRLRFLLAPALASFLLLTFLRIGPDDTWRESRYLVEIAPALALLADAALGASLSALPRLSPPLLLALAAWGAWRSLVWTWRATIAGLPQARPGLAWALAGTALALWAAGRRVPARCGLALLLTVPLACAPPGALSKHRASPDLAPRTPFPPPPGGGPPAGETPPATTPAPRRADGPG